MQPSFQPYQQPPMYTMQPVKKKRGCISPACGCCLGLGLLAACILGVPFACVMVILSGNPDPLYADYRADPTAAAQYDVLFDNAIADARNDGQFEVSIADRDFESWLNVEYRNSLTKNSDTNTEDLPGWVEDMKFQTKFDDNKVTLFGTTDISGFTFNILVTSEVSINQDPITSPTRPLDVKVSEFQVGSLDMPESFRTEIATSIADGLSEELTQVNQRYELTSLSIQGGVMRFSGHVVR